MIVLVVGLARAAGRDGGRGAARAAACSRATATSSHALLPLRFGYAGQLLFVVLFVLTGASLDFGFLAQAAGVAAAFIVARFLGKAAAILAFGRLSGLRAGGAGPAVARRCCRCPASPW